MEINTGDVIPLFDDELELLEDDKKARPVVPVMAPVSEVTPLPSKAVAKAKPAPKAAPAPVRRPNKEATPAIEAMETLVTTSLAARESVSDTGFSEAFLYVEKGPGAGQLVPVLQGDLTIGRSSESGLQLNHPSVSRTHAVLARKAEQYFLVDHGSQNGTYVNWAKIRGEVEVFPGDQISIGSAVVVLRGGVYTSAMRRGAVTGATETPGTPRWVIGSAIAAGFALAVGLGVGVAVMLSGKKAPAPVVAKPAVVAAAKPAAESVDAKPEPKAVETPKAEAKPEPVKVAEVAKPAPKVEPVAVAPREERRESRHEKASAKKGKHEKASKVASAEPAESGAASEAPEAVLKVYETGNVEAAIAAAEQANASKLASKMKAFNTAYTAGKDALASKDGGGAVTNFNKALKLDEQIDSGWGKLNGEIRGELANLYVLAGNQAMGRGDNDTAIKAFKAAQGYQPANGEARTKLKQLQGGASKARGGGDAKSAADAAFDG